MIVQDWDLLLHDEEDIHFGPTRYDGIHYSLVRRIVIQSRGYRNTITRKRDKRAKRITSGLCSRSCYTWVPNFSPLTLSYIAKQREWYMTKHKGSLEVSSCMCGSDGGEVDRFSWVAFPVNRANKRFLMTHKSRGSIVAFR